MRIFWTILMLLMVLCMPYEVLSSDKDRESRRAKRKAKLEQQQNTATEFNRNVVDVSDKVARNLYSSLAELLRGEFAGVTIRYGDEGTVVVLGGVSTMSESVEPLYLIDGTEALSYADAEAAVSLQDIHTVEVDKSGLGYGILGANGVVIIKTKLHMTDNNNDTDSLTVTTPTPPSVENDSDTTIK